MLCVHRVEALDTPPFRAGLFIYSAAADILSTGLAARMTTSSYSRLGLHAKAAICVRLGRGGCTLEWSRGSQLLGRYLANSPLGTYAKAAVSLYDYLLLSMILPTIGAIMVVVLFLVSSSTGHFGFCAQTI